MSLRAAARDKSSEAGLAPMAVPASRQLTTVKAGELSASIKDEICKFLDSQDTSHPFQFPQWSANNTQFALIRQKGELCWFASYDIQHPLAGTTLVRSAAVNRGPVCDDAELWTSGVRLFVDDLRRTGFAHVDIAPEKVMVESGRSNSSELSGWESRDSSGRSSLRVDLTLDCAHLFSRFRKTTRYEIKRAERLGVWVGNPASESGRRDFLDLYFRMSQRKGFTPEPSDHIHGVLRWLDSDMSRGTLLLARYEGETVGGIVVVRAGKRCWYVWGATDKDRKVNAGHILQWNALLWAKSQGCTQYDFGGYTVGATSGTAWFKQGFGGTPVHFPGVYRSVLHPLRYRILKSISRA